MNNNIDEIIPHLYISNWGSSNDPRKIKENNIKAVITIETRKKPDYILKYYRENNIDFLYLYIDDTPFENISKYFNISYDFIKKYIDKKENVLVHCYAGISRSSTIIFNYMLREYYLNNGSKCPQCIFKYFLDYSRNKRYIINPNIGFINQLLSYTQIHYRFKNKNK